MQGPLSEPTHSQLSTERRKSDSYLLGQKTGYALYRSATWCKYWLASVFKLMKGCLQCSALLLHISSVNRAWWRGGAVTSNEKDLLAEYLVFSPLKYLKILHKSPRKRRKPRSELFGAGWQVYSFSCWDVRHSLNGLPHNDGCSNVSAAWFLFNIVK